MIVSDRHVSIAGSCDVDEICGPLYKAGITYFEYLRTWNDGSRACLSNNAALMKQKLLSACVITTDFVSTIKADHLLWETVPLLLRNNGLKASLLEKQRVSKQFDIANGIIIIKKSKKWVDCYNFASTRDNTAIVSFYLNNLDLLDNFIKYFNERASSLIKAAIKDKFYFQKIKYDSSESANDKNALVNLETKKVFIDVSEPFNYLTAKEHECLQHIAHGKSFKETARLLNVSQRTVEHYLYNSKNRLHLNTTSELIDLFWLELGIKYKISNNKYV